MFDTNFGADLTIVEEANEFIRRLGGAAPLPMLTSCSPGWISFLERFYPELIPNASTCKSPMSMQSTLTKTYYAEKIGIDPKKIFSVAVMPCVAKKYEAQRPEHASADGIPYTDAVLTTRELIWMIKCYGLHLSGLPKGEFDAPLGISSGAADIFGSDRRRNGSDFANRQRTGDREAGPASGVLRSSRGRGPANGLRGHRRTQHSRRRCQRPDERKGPSRPGRRRFRAVSRYRSYGMPRRLHRRRRTALPAEGNEHSGSGTAPGTGEGALRYR